MSSSATLACHYVQQSKWSRDGKLGKKAFMTKPHVQEADIKLGVA